MKETPPDGGELYLADGGHNLIRVRQWLPTDELTKEEWALRFYHDGQLVRSLSVLDVVGDRRQFCCVPGHWRFLGGTPEFIHTQWGDIRFQLPLNGQVVLWFFPATGAYAGISTRMVPGWVEGADTVTLELRSGGSITARYDAIADSGVELVRLDRANRELWHATCRPLGVGHSKYHQDVELRREGNQLRVVSRGSAGTFEELRDLASGRRLMRKEDRGRSN
jgi:hypothetical protein